MELKIINPIKYPKWDDLLMSNDGYSFFYSSIWAKVLYKTYKYTPCYIISIANGKLNSLLAIMEVKSFLTGKRGISLPFSDCCNPIPSDNKKFHKVIDFAKSYGAKNNWKYLEIRGETVHLEKEIPSEHYFTHTLDLTKKNDRIFANCRESTKRNIKKAEREGVNVEFTSSFHSTREFYRLHCLTRKRRGLPPQPFGFFKNIFKYIISVGSGIIILAYFKKVCIAGAIFFHFGDKALFKYGASDKNYQHLRANNFIMWEAIKWYSKNGFRSFCFGRTEPHNNGLRQFKNGWGTDEHICHYYKYSFKKKTFVMNKNNSPYSYSGLFSKMPISILRIIGAVSYKHIA